MAPGTAGLPRPRHGRAVCERDHDGQRRHRESARGPRSRHAQHDMIQQLDRWGVKFQKTGDFDVKKVHHNGSVLPMPEGYDLKKILTRLLRRSGVRVSNRVMATRSLTAPDGSIVGVVGLNVRDGAVEITRARVVILCQASAGRTACFGLPVRNLREPGQCRRRVFAGLSRGRRADRHRVLPDQPAHQGLQRSCLRLCHRLLRPPSTRGTASSRATTGAAE